MKIKNDKYLRERGGTAHMIYVKCASCGHKVLYYQKDGVGWLKRCYLNRIFGPDKWKKLQNDSSIKEPNDIPQLVCECGLLMGIPMKHKDNRLAFRLKIGTFRRAKSS